MSLGSGTAVSSRNCTMSIEQDLQDLADAIDSIKTNDLHTLAKEVWQIKGGMAVIVQLSLGTFIRSFF